MIAEEGVVLEVVIAEEGAVLAEEVEAVDVVSLMYLFAISIFWYVKAT